MSRQQLDSRLVDFTVTSPSVDGPLHIRVLLPAGYAQSSTARYPVIYLFPGTGDTAAAWTQEGDAEAITAGRPVITVMPDLGVKGDGGGYCANWYNAGRRGKPMWETFEAGQVIPFIDRTFRTRATRDGRAIFGVSQGGFCALSLAARHPDMFVAAGSFSGVIDTTTDPFAVAAGNLEIQGTTKLDGVPDLTAMFGSRTAQELNWVAHDPAALVDNLRGMRLWTYTGNGRRGPLNPPSDTSFDASDEVEVHRLTLGFKAAADRAGVPVTLDAYGPGSHNWPYWQRDLRWVIGPVMTVFAQPPAAPARKAYRSADDPWSQWGYTVAITRPAREFSALRDGDRAGFVLSGSGTATVLTPAQYPPRARETVRLTGPHAHRTLVVRADREGRLRLSVPLGPGNRFQQYTAAARAAGGTRVYRTRVSISRR
ncbi:MAG TPA: alpha/beta hydrolase family protein [Solirubrobacteraceae bacterium]|nr:alpha/beta hydrolase family protein [Solirubrobacteraceae bacterium]